MAPPVSWSAFGHGVAVGRLRDQAYVLAALTGGAPADAVARWRAAPVDTLGMVVDGLERERRRGAAMWAEDYAKGPWGAAREMDVPVFSGAFVRGIVPMWWHYPTACADEDARMAATEDDVIARATVDPGWIHSPFAGHATVVYPPAMRAVLMHRVAVLAVAALAARTPRGDFPAQVPGLDLGGGTDRVALMAGGTARRWCVGEDTNVPLPRYIAPIYTWMADEDAVITLRVDPRGVMIDLDCDEVRGLPGMGGDATAASVVGGADASGAAGAP
jgi:hypothetical protein